MVSVTLDHLHLRSPDPEAAAQFYVDRLGGVIADRIETPEMLRMVVNIGGSRLFIERVPQETPPGLRPPYRGLEHIGFTVPDLAAAFAELKAAGIAFTLEPKAINPNISISFFRGPDDVLIELLERRG